MPSRFGAFPLSNDQNNYRSSPLDFMQVLAAGIYALATAGSGELMFPSHLTSHLRIQFLSLSLLS